MVRKQNIIVGRSVWVDHCTNYDLPEGLPHGAKVVVSAYDSAAHSVTVSAEGRSWEVDPIHLDTGWTFLLGGKYFDEHTQRAKAHIRRLIGELRRNPHPRFPDLTQDRIAEWLAVLDRNESPLAMAA